MSAETATTRATAHSGAAQTAPPLTATADERYPWDLPRGTDRLILAEKWKGPSTSFPACLHLAVNELADVLHTFFLNVVDTA